MFDGTGLPIADYLKVPLDEALASLEEGGIPIGAALFSNDGQLLGSGHSRRVQDGDPLLHAETAAFIAAGRRRDYADTVMVTTASLCWYCSGLVRQFGIGAVVVGDGQNFSGGHELLSELGIDVVVLDDPRCVELLGSFITEFPEIWCEDIGLSPLPRGCAAGVTRRAAPPLAPRS